MSRPAPIFVYGTLLSWAPQAGLLSGRQRVKATTRGVLYRMPAAYPALVQSGADVVHGELIHDVPERVLALLDLYEGVDQGNYERRRIDVEVGLRTVSAWAYVAGRDPARQGGVVIPSGEWRG